jgi:hypothetical protein
MATELPDLSCLIGNNLHDDLLQIDHFNHRNGSNRAVVDSIEIKLGAGENPRDFGQVSTGDLAVHFEASPDSLREQLSGIQKAGARAKVRTGGVTPDAIPPVDRVAGFLARCAAMRVAFKATAGLHHPIRCVRALTYEPNALQARMHGFVNVFIAAALAHQGVSEITLAAVIDSDKVADFHFDDFVARWRDSVLTTDQIRRAREQFAISFRSCSFEEPLEDLRNLHLL